MKCDCGEKTKGIPKHHYINENGKLVELDDAKGEYFTLGRCKFGCYKKIYADHFDTFKRHHYASVLMAVDALAQ